MIWFYGVNMIPREERIFLLTEAVRLETLLEFEMEPDSDYFKEFYNLIDKYSIEINDENDLVYFVNDLEKSLE